MKHLVTPRLLLRPFTKDDLGDLHNLYSNPETMKYISGRPRTFEESETALEKMIVNFGRDGYGMYAVIERREKRFIGRCGLQPLEDSGLIELGYTLLPSFWGKGFATEASIQILRTAFTDWGLERIVAIALEQNRASTRVMEKVGMKFSGPAKFYGKAVVQYDLEKPKISYDSSFEHLSTQSTRLSIPQL